MARILSAHSCCLVTWDTMTIYDVIIPIRCAEWAQKKWPEKSILTPSRVGWSKLNIFFFGISPLIKLKWLKRRKENEKNRILWSIRRRKMWRSGCDLHIFWPYRRADHMMSVLFFFCYMELVWRLISLQIHNHHSIHTIYLLTRDVWF